MICKCGELIERKDGPGRPPKRCVKCRSKRYAAKCNECGKQTATKCVCHDCRRAKNTCPVCRRLVKPGRKYCSPECLRAGFRQQVKRTSTVTAWFTGKAFSTVQRTHILMCAECGCCFDRTFRNNIGGKTRKFCDSECERQFRVRLNEKHVKGDQQRHIKGVATRRQKYGFVSDRACSNVSFSRVYLRKCGLVDCGKHFYTKFDQQMFCCTKHGGRANSFQRDGANCRVYTCECEWCGKLYCGRMKSCCSQSCDKKKRKRERKMKMRTNGPYENISWQKLIDDVFCVNCGVECVEPTGENLPNEATVDHINPISIGGTDTRDNTQLMCRKCNTEKNARTMEEFLEVCGG